MRSRTTWKRVLTIFLWSAAGWAEIVSTTQRDCPLDIGKTATAESKVLQEKVDTGHAPSRLLNRLFDGSPQNAEGIHVITTNYDTLLGCFRDLAGLPLDTGFAGFRRAPNRALGQYSRINTTESGWLKASAAIRSQALQNRSPLQAPRFH